MTDLTMQEAINETQKFSRILKGLEKLHETAQALAGADQVIAERTAKAEQLAAKVAELEAAAEQAQASIDQAKALAAPIIPGAQAQAASIVAAAEDAARQARAEAEGAVAAAQAELSAVRDDLASKRAQVLLAETELADIQSRITAALEQARKMFGGEG